MSANLTFTPNFFRGRGPIEMKCGPLVATIRKSVGKVWYMILTNEKTNKAWTSGVYDKIDAIRDAVDFISGVKPLPTTILGDIKPSREEYSGTIEQRKRTCSHCLITYPTMEIFGMHWKVCPARHLHGEFEPR